MKNQEQMIKLFLENVDKACTYKKQGLVQARLAIPGEKIETILDGVIETTNIAKDNDVIVKGIKGEEYIVSSDKFKSRYIVVVPLSNLFFNYEPNGSCFAYEYVGESFSFMAAWNEPMIVNSGDYLATTDVSVPEVYRIEKEAFFLTYEKVK